MRLLAAGIVVAGSVIAFAMAGGGEQRDVSGLVLLVSGILFTIEYYRSWKARSD